MTTIATHKAFQNLIESRGSELKIVDFQLDGHMSSDKKLACIYLYEPRGVRVFAWGVLSNNTCKSILGGPAARFHEAVVTVQRGAIRAGMIGLNVNVANILAAMFIACGQDAASVLESGWAQFKCNGQGEKWALAETMAAFALALELSTTSAMADNTFAKSHERLARLSKL